MIHARHLIRICALVAMANSATAQEICDNGVDDDADGLIDLNDTADCTCGNVFVPIPGAILNPSFEEYVCMPTSWSQLPCAENWFNASSSYTADYFLAGSYMPAWIPQPLPNLGHGCVGGYICTDYKEYIGACLTAPLQAGNTYALRFSIATELTNNLLSTTTTLDLGDLDLTLYGKTMCPAWPDAIALCPSSEGWTELGHVVHTPTDQWGTEVILFTPAAEMGAILLGAPCTGIEDYPAVFSSSWLPYFLYDAFSTEVSSSDGGLISTSGDLCQGDLVLLGHPPSPEGEYQWFQEGIAIAGQTDSTIQISLSGLGVGTYQFVSYANGDCSSTVFVLPAPVYPQPVIQDLGGTLYCEEAGSFQWYLNGEAIDGAAGQGFQPNENGTYTVEVTNKAGCSALSAPFDVLNVLVAGPREGGPTLRITNGILEVTGAATRFRFELFDPMGRRLVTTLGDPIRWVHDLSSLPAGCYVAVVDGVPGRLIR